MKIILLYSLLIFLSSCTSTYYINPSGYDELNKRLRKGWELSIVHDSTYQNITIDEINIGIDSTTYIESLFKREKVILTSSIIEVRDTYHSVGALQGLGLGFLSGSLIGAILAKNFDGSDLEYVVYSSFYGMLAGGIYGLIRGSSDIYFIQQEPDKNKSNAP